MSDLTDLKNLVDRYQQTIRHPSLEPLEVSGLYDLFPDSDNALPGVSLSWNDTWPGSGLGGVYAFVAADGEVLYVGKASMNSFLGARLQNYVRNGPNGGCELKHEGWMPRPRYVVTIALPDETAFEAPSIEEFLIRELNPSNNKAGRSA
jgi:hypothetical protein